MVQYLKPVPTLNLNCSPTAPTQTNRPASSAENHRPTASTDNQPAETPDPALKEAISLFMKMFELFAQMLDFRCARSPVFQVADCPYLSSSAWRIKSVSPDLAFYDKNYAIFGVVKVSNCYLFPDQPGQCPTKEQLTQGKVGEELHDLVAMMAVAAVRFGLLTDGFTLIIIELNDDVSYYEDNYLYVLPNGRKQMRLAPGECLITNIRTIITNKYKPFPSIPEAVLAFLGMAKQGKDEPYSKIFDYFQLAFGDGGLQL